MRMRKHIVGNDEFLRPVLKAFAQYIPSLLATHTPVHFSACVIAETSPTPTNSSIVVPPISSSPSHPAT